MPVVSLLKEKELQKDDAISFYHISLFVLCFISSAIGGTISTLMSVYLPVVVAEILGAGKQAALNHISGYINAVFIYGWAFGGFTWGLISDRLGRKKALLCAIASYGFFTVLTGYMTSAPGIVLCRFLSGFGVGGVLVVSFALLSEVWPRRTRAVYMGILSIAFPVGIFSAGLINYIVASWREGFLVGCIPLLIAFVGIWLIQESPTWTLHRRAARMDAAISLFSNSHRRKLVLGSLTFGTMLIGLWAIFSWMPSWIQSMVPEADAQKARGMSMMFLGVGGLTGGFLSGWLVNLLGARKSMLACFAVCAVLSFLLFKTNTTVNAAVYAKIAVLALFFGASQGVLSSYIPHLFPTGIRASATGFCFNIGRLFTATAVLFVGVLVNSLGGFGNALLIFSLVFIAGFMVVVFVREESAATVKLSSLNAQLPGSSTT